MHPTLTPALEIESSDFYGKLGSKDGKDGKDGKDDTCLWPTQSLQALVQS